MAEIKTTISEQCKFSNYIEVDENGNETVKNDSNIIVKTDYNVYINPFNYVSGNEYAAKSFKGVKFDKKYLKSNYKDKYFSNNATSVKIYLSDYTDENDTIEETYYTGYCGRVAMPHYFETKQTEKKNFILINDGYYTLFPTEGYNNISVNSWNYTILHFDSYFFDKSIYIGSGQITYSGIGSVNEPYMDIIWTRCDPEIKGITPASKSFFDDSHSNTITWQWDIAKSDSGIFYSPTELYFLWGTTEATENTITLSPSDTSVEIPANTFPNQSTVYWRFKYKSDAYEGYLYTDVSTYTINDGIPSVKILSPINVSVDGTIDNTFTWIYQIDTASKQKAFDLQYSANNGLSWENVFTKEPSGNTFAVIPANTFNAGNNLWKVRVYNTDDVASEWSTPASIVVRAAPIKPTISSVTKKPKITVGWQSTGQQAFQVIANDIDSGVVFGTEKTYTIPYYFRDGETVNIKVRIKNRFSEWSEWSEISVTVENTSTGNITSLVQNVGNDVKLIWSADTEFVCFYVLRGNIPIAKTTNLKEYTDYTSIGANEYQIMGITSDGYYTLSNVVPVSVFPQTSVIGILSNAVSWITLTYRRGNLPEIVTSSSEDIYYQHYSGRTLPVANSSRFKSKTKILTFTVYKEDADKIENMIGQTVIYKDYAGNKIIGIVNNVESSSYAIRPDVRLEITAIDYQEDVGYDD